MGHRGVNYAAAVGLALVAAGCGGSDEAGDDRAQSEAEVRAVIEGFQLAVAEGDSKTACAALTDEMQRPRCQISERWSPGALARAEIGEIRFSAEAGAGVGAGGAEVDMMRPGGDNFAFEIQVHRVDGEWQISFFPIAVY